MWLLWVVIAIAAFVLYIVFLGVATCPRCGVEIGVDIGRGFSHRVGTDHCRSCGWRRGERP